jgi:site-specific DNA-methyltransferase (adenine-specific)
MLDKQSGVLTSGNNPSKRSADKHRTVYGGWKGEQCLVHRKTDSGGASRFFYTAKASPSERGEGNTHPTVKPIALIKYLIKLACPPGGIVVDPFIGSGTTMKAALELQRQCVGVDLEYGDIQENRTKNIQIELFT